MDKDNMEYTFKSKKKIANFKMLKSDISQSF